MLSRKKQKNVWTNKQQHHNFHSWVEWQEAIKGHWKHFWLLGKWPDITWEANWSTWTPVGKWKDPRNATLQIIRLTQANQTSFMFFGHNSTCEMCHYVLKKTLSDKLRGKHFLPLENHPLSLLLHNGRLFMVFRSQLLDAHSLNNVSRVTRSIHFGHGHFSSQGILIFCPFLGQILCFLSSPLHSVLMVLGSSRPSIAGL